MITLSILLAFSLDAWWNNQQLEKAQKAMLLTIRGELIISVEEIARAQAIHESVAMKLEAWADVVGPDYRGPMTDSLLSVLMPIRIASTDVPGAMIAEFQKSYGVGALSDPELVVLFSKWPAHVQDYQKTEANLANVIVTFKDMIQELAPGIPELYPTISGVRESKYQPDWNGLMTDFRFENHIFNALNLSALAINENRALSDAAIEMIEGIDRYLE